MGYFDDILEEKNDSKEQKIASKTDFIPNPLPVPKRREHVEMDYDYPVPEQMMYFDIDNPKDDHFDIE